MTKQEIYRSFQNLNSGRFRRDNGNNALVKKQKNIIQPTSVAKNNMADSESEDESSLFLEAVTGNMDVSMKHSDDVPAPRPPRFARVKSEATIPVKAGIPEPAEPPMFNPTPPEETLLFADAMDGVSPIRSRGRDLAPPSKLPLPIRGTGMADINAMLGKNLTFSLEYTDEFVQGYVQGLNPVVFSKLKAGAYSPEAHVDLHGLNMEQAYVALASFVKHAYQSGKRHLIVVTGRGKNSPGGTPVLRERVQSWFTRDPFKRVVLGFCSAKPGDGGVGALYLLLRKQKKSQGKIVWNSVPSEEELLL